MILFLGMPVRPKLFPVLIGAVVVLGFIFFYGFGSSDSEVQEYDEDYVRDIEYETQDSGYG